MRSPPGTIYFTVPGTPRPKQRARRNPDTGKWYTPAATERYEREVAWYARQAMRRCNGVPFPLKNPIRLYCDFYGPNARADVDNIVKAIADGISQARLWADDHQAVTMQGNRLPADEGHQYPRRADVRLYVVGGNPNFAEAGAVITLGEHAATLAAAGFAVLPLRPKAKVPHGYLVPHGALEATGQYETITTWWAREPMANIGIATGHGKLLVVDIDPDKGGYETARVLADYLPLTLAALTGSGGMHLYYLSRAPKNSAGKLGPGIDTRGEGGYVVAPPSIHPNGTAYAWLARSSRPRRPIAAPAALERLLSPAPPPTRVPAIGPPALPSTAAVATRYALAAMAGMTQDVRYAPEGTRNATLHHAARRTGRLYAGGHLDFDTTSEHLSNLLRAAETAGLDSSEARATIESGYRFGRDYPIEVPVRDPLAPPSIAPPSIRPPR